MGAKCVARGPFTGRTGPVLFFWDANVSKFYDRNSFRFFFQLRTFSFLNPYIFFNCLLMFD